MFSLPRYPLGVFSIIFFNLWRAPTWKGFVGKRWMVVLWIYQSFANQSVCNKLMKIRFQWITGLNIWRHGHFSEENAIFEEMPMVYSGYDVLNGAWTRFWCPIQMLSYDTHFKTIGKKLFMLELWEEKMYFFLWSFLSKKILHYLEFCMSYLVVVSFISNTLTLFWKRTEGRGWKIHFCKACMLPWLPP